MYERSELEMARLAIAKVTRDEIRLRYRLMADMEINKVLPKRLMDFDISIQKGELPALELKLVTSG